MSTNTVSIACQIDLIVQDLAALEDNYHRKAIELSGIHVAKEYPDEKDLKCNQNLLHLCQERICALATYVLALAVSLCLWH